MGEPDADAETFYIDIPYEPEAFHFFDATWVLRVSSKPSAYHLEAYELFLDRNAPKLESPVAVLVQVYLLSKSNEENEALIGEGLHRFGAGQDSNMIAVYGKTEACADDRLKIVMREAHALDVGEEGQQTKSGKFALNILSAHGTDDFDSECLSAELSNLLASQTLSDVELRVGDQSIHAHGCILAARSEWFKRELDGSRTSLEIEESDFEAVNIFVNYIYSGKLPAMDIEQARELCRLAYRYGVNSLKKTMSNVLASNFSERDVLDTLRLADEVADARLKERAVEYVIDSRVILSQAWKDFSKSNGKLSREVCKAYIERSSEKDLDDESASDMPIEPAVSKRKSNSPQNEKKTKVKIWRYLLKR